MPLEAQRNAARRWANELQATNRSASTIRSYISTLSILARKHPKPFDKLTRDDLSAFLKDYSGNTQNSFGICLKLFLRWLAGTETAPDNIRWWRAKTQRFSVNSDQILSEDEVRKMVAEAPGLLEKTLIHVLYDSGCRIGELLSLRRNNVQPPKAGPGKVISVTGKTGPRSIRLVSSAPILTDWINQTPAVRDALVFPISHTTAWRIVSQAGERSLGKKIHPHLLRHSKATEYTKRRVGEAALREHFGWVQGSNIVSRYVHLSGADVDREILRANGIEIDDEKLGERALKTVKCPTCGLENDPTYSFCQKCAASLTQGAKFDEEAAVQLLASHLFSNSPAELKRAAEGGLEGKGWIAEPGREADFKRFMDDRTEEVRTLVKLIQTLGQQPKQSQTNENAG